MKIKTATFIFLKSKRHGKFLVKYQLTKTDIRRNCHVQYGFYHIDYEFTKKQFKTFEERTFLLTLPVVTHTCPRCQTQTSKIHDCRNQPIKTLLLINTEFSFISRYQRMSSDLIAQILQEHGFLTTSKDIACRYKISTTAVQRLFRSISPASSKLSNVISIDEFKGNVGAKFQVVINDLINYTCLNIIEDRSPDTLYASGRTSEG